MSQTLLMAIALRGPNYLTTDRLFGEKSPLDPFGKFDSDAFWPFNEYQLSIVIDHHVVA